MREIDDLHQASGKQKLNAVLAGCWKAANLRG
jgi:hypothetical protein